MPSPGQRLPDLDVTLHTGEVTTLGKLAADGPLVVFFYPKAFTGGCTAEACHFRDLAAEFAAVGANRVGVSRDDVATQARFAESHGFDYPLLADPAGAVAKAFGAKRPGPLWSKRQTFVVDTDLTLLGAINSETDMERHADEALELLRQR
ncbi:peroxiredoxin [Nitriliruptor alkaliphilus]|uniref:peroxiredoxin n=1 Tax=Nitriliruptor alkaliphilus TaxID=427918 RepID=UPI000696C14A|nr:peroxiredoxin [Nitriliruptor alkaliphilus]